jgi:TET-Associated Glycosyltransferase
MRAYIFTRSRPDSLIKVVPAWQAQQIPITLVVEPDEFGSTLALRDERLWTDTSILSLPLPNRGMGAARAFAVLHARSKGYKSVILSDDDIRPARFSDMGELLYEAARPGVLGVGAVHGLQDRFTSGAITANKGKVILCPGGWGFTLYALNVSNALSAGNFDPELDCFGEDAELARNGIARLRIPWRVHCGVWADYFSKRGDPGGFSAMFPDGTRAVRESACRAIIHERWPEYASAPDKAARMLWNKFLTKYIPDWKSRSAIHGGSL